MVALRKESVDRNKQITETMKQMTGSLSARRAWIEIVVEYKKAKEKAVALRKESVDRNVVMLLLLTSLTSLSLSARRAWIEITYVTRLPRCQVVALRKESVDRNCAGYLRL